MKKFITIFISCSLALAAGAMAQQDETSPAPNKKKNQQAAEAGQEAAPPTGQQHAQSPQYGNMTNHASHSNVVNNRAAASPAPSQHQEVDGTRPTTHSSHSNVSNNRADPLDPGRKT